MFTDRYFHQAIRKHVLMFGTLFNDIVVQRFDNSNARIQTLAVPIAYGPKEKWMVRINGDRNLDKKVAIQIPRISFEMTGLQYDGQRALAATQKNYATVITDDNKVKYQYFPVPWDFNMQLAIYVKNADDGAQILEQIMPYFKPEFTASLYLLPEMSIKNDIPVILQNVTNEDTYEGDFQTRRALIWTLDFIVKGWIYGPVRTSGGLIKRTQIDFYLPATIPGYGNSTMTDSDVAASKISGPESRIVITPGLLANGAPTTNSAASIPYSQINANDEWGFCVDYFDSDEI